jgi:hypothetical protein
MERSMRKIALAAGILGLTGLTCGTVEEVAPTARAAVPEVAPTAAPLGSTADPAETTVCRSWP